MSKRIVFIGAAGEMAREALKRVVEFEKDATLLLTDLNEKAVKQVAEDLGGQAYARVDLYDAAGLKTAIAGADLVVNGAGPYRLTAEPVMQACVEAGINYLDFDDDTESITAALSFDDRAKAAGVSVLIGCGASPGWSNVIAVDVVSHLDMVENIDVVWAAGDEGARPYGDAVIEHFLHALAGEAVTVRHGDLTTVALGHSEIADFGPLGIGPLRVYEVGHPEPVMFLRRFKDQGLKNARCLGGFTPAPVMGMFKGLADAVYGEELTMKEATRFLQAVLADQEPDMKPWKYAIGGMWEQVLKGEVPVEEFQAVIGAAVRGEHVPFTGGLMVTATGLKDGQQRSITRRIGFVDDGWKSMGDATGACTAAFVNLALQGSQPAGVLTPEDWADPLAFLNVLEAQGASADSVSEPSYVVLVPASR